MEEHLNNIQEKLVNLVCEHMEDTDKICTTELGEVIDMIKDLAETKYYHTIVESMSGGTAV